MLKKILFLLVALGATASNAHEFRRAKTFEDAYLASCRVDVSNARGTGTFIGVDKTRGKGVVLTNYHVVTTNQTATLNFWKDGEQKKVTGKVFARYYDANMPSDFALLYVELSDLAAIDPPYVALGGSDAAPDVNSYILSSGAPKGRFVQAWKGKVLGYYRGATLLFQPGPVPGQSGSGVLSEINGELWLTAILTWLIGTEGADDSKGGAIPIANLYKSLQGKQTSTPVASPIPPDAVECASNSVRVVEITRDNCEACNIAKSDVSSLQNNGIEVELINSSIDPSSASAYNAKAFPTFVVLVNGQEKARYVGAGKSSQIQAKVEELTPKELTTPPTVAPAFEEDLEPELSLDYLDQLTNGFQSSETIGTDSAENFRTRKPVYDLVEGVGFFEDSDSCWRKRGADRNSEPLKKIEPEQKKNPPIVPEQPKLDESKLGDRIGNRLSGALGQQLGNELGKVAGVVGEEIESKIESKIETLKAEARTTAKRYACKAVFYSFALVFVASFLAIVAVCVVFSCTAKAYQTLLTLPVSLEDADEEQEEKEPPKPKRTTKRN